MILRLAVPLALLAGGAIAQPAPELRGQAFHLGEHGEKIPEVGIIVILQENGESDDTNDQGFFRLPLRLSSGGTFKPGDKVTLDSDKRGWRIRYPLNGEERIPAHPDREIVKVELLPVGSKLFLTHDQLEKLIRDMAEKQKQAEARETRKPGTGPAAGAPRRRPGTKTNRQSFLPMPLPPAFQPGPTIARAGLLRGLSSTAGWDTGRASGRETSLPAPVFDPFVQEWAAQYGFSTEEVKAAISRWITDIQNHRGDAYRLGLAAFVQGEFAGAARLFRRSARALPIRPDEREELVRDLRLEGDSFRNEGDLPKALASYREAHSHTSHDRTPELWAATLHDIALAQGSLGYTGTTPAASAAEFAEAAQAYRQTLDIYTREKRPRQWAMTQNNLGVALREQALRADGTRAPALLAEAEEAYRQALLVYTRERFPQDRATTLNNLGIVLRARAEEIKDERGARLLAEAVDAYREALRLRTREELPEDWARTQNNLGTALQEQASRTGGEVGAQLLVEAVHAFEQALLVRTRERLPQQWATTQNNLGSALRDQARRTDGEAGTRLLTRAIDAYRQALRVHTRQQFPQEWAMIQNNLGNALFDQALRTDGESGARLLAQSVQAFRQALLVRTRDQLPQQWALSQTNLGNALVEQAVRAEGPGKARLFEESLQAYRQAQKVFTPEHFPRSWDIAQRGEAQVLLLSGSYREAAGVLSDILTRHPDDARVFSSLVLVLNNGLFEPDRALSILQPWLTRHPGDLTARLLEIEALFASGAFAECRTKAASLRETEEAAVQDRAVLLAYQLAAGLATGGPEALADLALLLETIAREPSSFNAGRTFPAALQALREHPDLPQRDWLIRFFQALEAPDRDSMLRQLRELGSQVVRLSTKNT